MLNDELLIEISAYADGELGAERARALEEKLRTEPALRREIERFTQLDHATAALPVPQLDDKLNAIWQGLAPGETLEISDEIKAAAREVPAVSAQRFDAVWKKVAEQTVSPSTADRAGMLRSARADGELDGGQRSTREAALENSEYQRELNNWRSMDVAAATLAVPKMSELTWREVWNHIHQHKEMNAAERRAIEKIERGAAELPVPAVSDERFAARWDRIAGQLARTPYSVREELAATGTPIVSEERWNAMWKRVAARTALKQAGPISASASSAMAKKIPPRTSNLCMPAVIEAPQAPASPNIVRADFTPTAAPRKRRWTLLAVAGIAAAIVLSATLFPHTNVEPTITAFEIPEALDERYGVQVQYLGGQREPVVCFFLKSNAEEKNESKVKDWQWLPD